MPEHLHEDAAGSRRRRPDGDAGVSGGGVESKRHGQGHIDARDVGHRHVGPARSEGGRRPRKAGRSRIVSCKRRCASSSDGGSCGRERSPGSGVRTRRRRAAALARCRMHHTLAKRSPEPTRDDGGLTELGPGRPAGLRRHQSRPPLALRRRAGKWGSPIFREWGGTATCRLFVRTLRHDPHRSTPSAGSSATQPRRNLHTLAIVAPTGEKGLPHFRR